MANHNNFKGMIDEMEFPTTNRNYYFLNLGETHYPYMLSGDGLPHISGLHGALKGMDDTAIATAGQQGFEPAFRWRCCAQQQIKCVEYVDTQVGRLMELAPPNTHFIVTADHGELFGEDRLLRPRADHAREGLSKCLSSRAASPEHTLMAAPLFLLAPPRSYTSLDERDAGPASAVLRPARAMPVQRRAPVRVVGAHHG